MTITDTNGSAIITNNTVGTNGGTNVLSTTGDWTKDAPLVTTNVFSYTGTNGITDTSGAIPTNVGVWTVIKAATNSSGQTNVTAITYIKLRFRHGNQLHYQLLECRSSGWDREGPRLC